MSQPAPAILLTSEQAARAWLQSEVDPTPTQWDRLERYAAGLIAGSEAQNLIAASTLPTLWVRHIADSAQLVPLARDAGSSDADPWIDIGSGAGLPGIVAAILTDRPMVLVEPRRLRCAFLKDTVEALGLAHRVAIHQGRVEGYRPGGGAAGVLSARAVAALPMLIAGANPLAGANSRWLLPKGAGGRAELASLSPAWHDRVTVVPSRTEAGSVILCATGRFPLSSARTPPIDRRPTRAAGVRSSR